MLKLVLSVIAVVILAGGGYFFFAPNAKDLNIMQYVPESIAAYLPGGVETEVVDASSSEPFFQDGSTLVTEEENATQVTDLNNDPEITQVQAIDEENKALDSVDPLVEENIETSSQEVVEAPKKIQENQVVVQEKIVQKEKTQDVIANKPPEVIKLENKLVDMNSSISELDEENERLQKKFKAMLKKNKDLAITLGQLEAKLKLSN